ncbi:MAG TPA: carboxypeptidase regulatory-like domain-containing protein, partial [Gemmatimonadales bacterium]|nr:carboxypeptidase regulatory-like domain-containing protein [Gemmatimonadales bacterium]
MPIRSVRYLPSLLLLALPPRAVAQGTLGKLEGRVTDLSGQPLAAAQLQIVGTAFSALTNPRGYYFINNLPAGIVDIRAALIGFDLLEVRGLRILAGQTVTQDFALATRVIELQEIEVVSAVNALVPRDEVTTRQRLDGAYTESLPVDHIANALVLQPGVVAGSQRSTLALSIRGGRSDEAAVFIDGVPVNPAYRGGTEFFSSSLYRFRPHGLELPVNGLEEASVVSGAPAAEYGNAQSGIVSLQTRSGGSRLSGSLGYETDEPLGLNHSIGFNRVRASLSGPITHGFSWIVSGSLEGRKSSEDGPGAEKYPIFVAAGFDTTVAVPVMNGPLPIGVDSVDVQRFAVYRGRCEDFKESRNPDIARNYGLECQGIRIPSSASSSYQLLGKLAYSYGNGSRLVLSAAGSQNQGRLFQLPNVFDNQYNDLYNPTQLRGNRDWSRVYSLTLTQNLARSAERALALDLALSYQQDRSMEGPLSPSTELSTRDPFGGFLIKPLGFRFDFDNFPLDEQLVENFRWNRDTARITPYDIKNPEQYRTTDLWRNNAYGLLGFTENGGPTGLLRLYEENRVVARAALDWQVDRYNRVRAGGESVWYYIGNYRTGDIVTNFFTDVYREHPNRWAVYTEDRLDVGDLVLVGGLRYDYYDSGAERPRRIPADSSLPDDEVTNRTTPRVRDQSHNYLSPHLQVAFPITQRTSFRASYAHQVQAPDFSLVLHGVNGHPAVPSLGSDLDFGRTISFEFGLRHSFSDDMVLDISAYNKNKLADPAERTQSYYNAIKKSRGFFSVMTNADYGIIRGVDLRLDRRIGQLFNGMLGYTYQHAENTGSNPFTIESYTSLVLTQLGGGPFQPPQGMFETDDNRPHNLTGSFALNFPVDWHRGSAAAGILRGAGVFGTFRFASGTPYTKCPNDLANQGVLSFDIGCSGRSLAVVVNNGARLPMQKQFDLRLTKAFGVGPMALTAYLDARNVFNFQNIVRVFSST